MTNDTPTADDADIEKILAVQTQKLDTLFADFLGRTFRHGLVYDKSLLLALRAQQQCRASIATLSKIKIDTQKLESKTSPKSDKPE